MLVLHADAHTYRCVRTCLPLWIADSLGELPVCCVASISVLPLKLAWLQQGKTSTCLPDFVP